MIMRKICTYLSRLDGVTVGELHDSHSQYFDMTDVKVRVSDHFAIKANYPTTLNIVCEREDFVVTYGNKILPIKNYSALRVLLRNFAMISDILAPLAETRQQVKIIERVTEKVVLPPGKSNPDWVYIGDLPDKYKPGIHRNVENVKKMAHIK